jgi:hypothetical protein
MSLAGEVVGRWLNNKPFSLSALSVKVDKYVVFTLLWE